MTAPRAAGSGVRVRERAGRWGGRDGGGDRAAGYRRVSWRGGNPPFVAKVSSWRRTPEGPLRAREVAVPEPARLLPLSKGSTESPPLTAFSCCPPAVLGKDSGRDYHWDALTAATFPSEGSVGREDHLHEERGRFLAAAAPPNLSHILRKGGFLRQLL
uniref:Uncharacterized protein n=1 Tax=Rangifer tarandus platyrhynchus TaxID=3082113 RepID=A0ACB0E309_RANTA|nr:unnamed protein product [Rangifer tarandus platyrhynchus]